MNGGFLDTLLGARGIEATLQPDLSVEEEKALRQSAHILQEAARSITEKR